MSSQIDDQTVFSQLDMDVPEDALVGDDTNNTVLDERIKETLRKNSNGRIVLKTLAREYRASCDDCSDAVHALATILLPTIFEDNQDSLVESYKDAIKHNPWLVGMLLNAFEKGTYSNIRRIGLCGS